MMVNNFPEEMLPVIQLTIKEKRVVWLPYHEGFAELSVFRFTWGGCTFEYEEMLENPFSIQKIGGEPNEEYLIEYLRVAPKTSFVK